MKTLKILAFIFLALMNHSCDEDLIESSNKFSLTTKSNKKIFKANEPFELTVQNRSEIELDSIVYFKNDTRLESPNVTISNEKLGTKLFLVKVYSKGEHITVKKIIEIIAEHAPEKYEFTIVNEYPHDKTSYTQGLEFSDDVLYEGTGQYTESKLRKIDYVTGTVLKSVDLDEKLFGEGITIFNDKVYQLTWKARKGMIYNKETFEKEKEFNYTKSIEGWGLCNDGSKIYKSDGSEKIWTLNPDTMEEESFIQVYTNKVMVGNINELEWINGKIYANIYQRNGIIIINPETGAVEGLIDGTSLAKKVTVNDKMNEVINGIAYHKEKNTVFVTGKNWNKLFELKITE